MKRSEATNFAKARSSGTPVRRRPSLHGEPLRGCTFAASALLKPGRFGMLFRGLPRAEYGTTDKESENKLAKLGGEMSQPDSAALKGRLPDIPNDHPDERESGIPALYTYFGQFVDHDLTFDPSSSLQKRSDPDALVDFRTPAFDLDSVYGGGPSDQPYMYDDATEHPDGSARLFLVGKQFSLPTKDQPDKSRRGKATGWDLPRNFVLTTLNRERTGIFARALIGDPRNDENLVVTQLHGLFLRFHNRLARQKDKPSFDTVQQNMRFHYQYLILQDFLPRIIHSSVLDQLKADVQAVPDLIQYDRNKLKYFRCSDQPFIPVEFSVAAYRMGHSMVRPTYRLNQENVRFLFKTAKVPLSTPTEDMRGFRQIDQRLALDWARFVDTQIRSYEGSPAVNMRRLQFAFKIDTSLADPLAHLPEITPPEPKSLAERNLLRSFWLRLPSGQRAARAMGIPDDKILKDAQILIGPDKKPITKISRAFKDNCPLWTYILAEAMEYEEAVEIPVAENIGASEDKKIKHMTPKLGPVGGRIVAEVFLGLMYSDPNSMLNLYPNWKPKDADSTVPDPYTLKDFVQYALEYRPTREVTIPPLGM